MNEKKLSLIMPSFENEAMKKESLESLVLNTQVPVYVYQYPEKINYGWIKGCNLGIVASKEFEYIALANDDILVPATNDWAQIMVGIMDTNPEIGALSTLSYNVLGYGRLNGQTSLMKSAFEVPYTSFFFVMLRNEAITKTGLLDESLPGGDDLDYCLRLKEAGYKIAITPQVFIWHHYAQTGKRVFGEYWDSEEHKEKISHALIRKYGFSKFAYNF